MSTRPTYVRAAFPDGGSRDVRAKSRGPARELPDGHPERQSHEQGEGGGVKRAIPLEKDPQRLGFTAKKIQ